MFAITVPSFGAPFARANLAAKPRALFAISATPQVFPE